MRVNHPHPRMLTDAKIRSAKPLSKPYKLSDGRGLQLLVHPSSGKYWQVRYRFLGKEKTASLGTYPDVSLIKARELCGGVRRQIREGIDPTAQRRLEKLNRLGRQEKTFSVVANQWFSVWSKGKAESTVFYKRRRLDEDLLPNLGHIPIAEVSRGDVIAAITAISERGVTELPHRALQVVKSILSFAVIHEYREFSPVSDLKPSSILGVEPTKHHACISVQDLPELLEKIENYQGLNTRYAMKLLALTFVRTGELRGARWDEFDIDNARWVIPAERMKKVKGSQRPHVVPLSSQAVGVLRDLSRDFGQKGYLFPGQSGQVMSENTILKALERLGYKGQMTGHGFRQLASTILHERGFEHLHIERQLAHQDRDEVSAAYNFAEFLEQRKEMMQWWGNFLQKSLQEKRQKLLKVVA